MQKQDIQKTHQMRLFQPQILRINFRSHLYHSISFFTLNKYPFKVEVRGIPTLKDTRLSPRFMCVTQSP